MAERTKPLNYRVTERWLREELTTCRETLGWSKDKAAKKLDWSTRTMNRIELGPTPITAAHISQIGRVYDLSRPKIHELLETQRAASQTGWWNDYADLIPGVYSDIIELEDRADSIRVCAMIFPGFLQAPEYAAAIQINGVSGYGSQAQRYVKLKAERQERLFKRDASIQVLLDANAPLRCFTPEIQNLQTDLVLRLEAEGRLELRVIPLRTQINMLSQINVFQVGDRKVASVSILRSELLISDQQSYEEFQSDFDKSWGESVPLSRYQREIEA